MARFIIQGEVKSKSRYRFNTETGRTYTPDDTVSFQNLVKMEYRIQSNEYFEDGIPLSSKITVYMTIPKSFSKKKRAQAISHQIFPTKKPDLDNIIKVIFDSLNKIAYHDDKQIVYNRIVKLWSERPRTEVIIEPMKVKEE